MATLIAVNVGMPRDVPWKGRVTHTGVWKRPVTGPRMVRKLNIDGDGQGDLAGHGGPYRAVLVYQVDSYRHWQKHLHRGDFTHGQFGENFTVDGLPDDEVCIGDHYRIGDALFEVTQPRVTCYRVGLRMDEPQMPALLVAHGRPGFYFKVLTEGFVQAGDEIVKVSAGPEAMTVAEIDAVLYKPGRSRSQVERALRIPALSPGWKTSMQSLLDDYDQKGSSTGSTGGNTGLTSAATSPPCGLAWLPTPGGQAHRPGEQEHLLPHPRRHRRQPAPRRAARPVHHRPNAPRSARHARHPQLLPVRAPRRRAIPDQRQTGTHGVASTYLDQHVAVDDVLDVAAPRGTFTLAEDEAAIVLVSAGCRSHPGARHAPCTGRQPRPAPGVVGPRSPGRHGASFRPRSTRSAVPPSVRPTACLLQPPARRRPSRRRLHLHRLTTAQVLEDLDFPPDANAYICGPVAFMDDMTKALVDCGLDPARIHTEAFGSVTAITPGVVPTDTPPPHLPAHPPGSGTGPSVSFARSGLTVPWDPGYGTLLELAEACDVPVQWSCRTGVCHTCETAVVSGHVDYFPDPIDLPAEGNALICCSQPPTDLILDL